MTKQDFEVWSDKNGYYVSFGADVAAAYRASALLKEHDCVREREQMADEILLLSAVLNQARETLLIGIKGTPEELQQSLGKLNLACKAHWDWQTEKNEGIYIHDSL